MKVIFMFFSTCYFEIINVVGVVLFLQTSFAVCAWHGSAWWLLMTLDGSWLLSSDCL